MVGRKQRTLSLFWDAGAERGFGGAVPLPLCVLQKEEVFKSVLGASALCRPHCSA